jgi:hypothetical protein
MTIEVCKKFIRGQNFNIYFCTGSGDEEFGEMTVDSPHEQRKELTAEEEKLLYGSDDERRMEKEEDTEMRESEDEDEARRRAEKEADEEDLRARHAELTERIRRRKEERQKRINEQRLKEMELHAAEQHRLREEAEAETRAQMERARMLEEELRKARGEAGNSRDKPGEKRGRSESVESKQESVASTAMGANMLNLPAGYRAVRSTKLNSLAVRHLNGGSAIPFQPIGSFANDQDARIRLANTISDATSSRNISSSFNLESFICNTCTTRGEHKVLGKKSEGDDGTMQSPPCFVLSDQNFPAVLPVEGEGDCFKVIQVENASLSDLTTVFLAAVEGFTMPAGAVVLISSLSHLAAAGTAAYAEDLVRAYKAVRAVYGNGITVMHGIPFLLSGIQEHSTIRSLLEIGTWYSGVSSLSTKELSSSLALLTSKLKPPEQTSTASASGTPDVSRAPERFLLKMPQNLHSYDKQICVSEGFDDQVSLCQPIEEGEEYELINTMIDELNAKCGLDLSHEISLYRPAITSKLDRPDFTDEVTERVVMVGGSHNSRLTDELDDTCLEVMDISVRGWRLSEAAVEEKARELSEIVSSTDESRTTIVYQLYDNSSYYVKKQDGSRSLPCRGGDGKYHVDGKLEIATREETKRLVSTSIPLLRAGGKCRKVILTPSGRYRYNPCCNIRGHCCNMKDSNYGRWMEEKMAEMRGIVRDYVRMRNIKRATVMEFGQLITPAAGQSSYLHEEEIWGEDPVHYTSKGYSLAAAGLESLVYEKRSEEKEIGSSGGQGPSKKAKMDLSLKRPDWVKGSVAEAVRRDTGGHARPPLPQGKWRGPQYDSYRGGSSRGRGSDRGRGRGADRGRGSDRGRGRGVHPGGRGWPSRGHYYKKW